MVERPLYHCDAVSGSYKLSSRTILALHSVPLPCGTTLPTCLDIITMPAHARLTTCPFLRIADPSVPAVSPYQVTHAPPTLVAGISKTKQTRRNWHIPSGKLVWGRWGPALCVLCLVYAGGGLVLGIVELASLSEADASITLQGSPLESLNLGQRTTHLSEVLTCSSRPPLNGDRPRVGSFHCSSF